MTQTKAHYRAYLKSPEWKEKRKEILARDDNRCRLCNSKKDLHVHHRSYDKLDGREASNDLISLCEKCHDLFHEHRHLSVYPDSPRAKENREKKMKKAIEAYKKEKGL